LNTTADALMKTFAIEDWVTQQPAPPDHRIASKNVAYNFARDFLFALPRSRPAASGPNGRFSMKVNIEIECTAVEARQFFGLPNVEPMQAAVMQELEKRILADIDRFSPETLMTSWLPLVPQGAEQIQAFFRGIFPPTSGPPKE
jgi:hypothetical protein